MKKLLRLISVATMLLAATTFMACSSDDDDDSSGARSVSARNSGSVVGVVLDNKGEPVEGATVTLGGKTAKTNYGGEFEITGVNPNDSKLIKAAKTEWGLPPGSSTCIDVPLSPRTTCKQRKLLSSKVQEHGSSGKYIRYRKCPRSRANHRQLPCGIRLYAGLCACRRCKHKSRKYRNWSTFIRKRSETGR